MDGQNSQNQINNQNPSDLRRAPQNPQTSNQDFINPNNFHQVLGQENVVVPQNMQPTPAEIAMEKMVVGQQIKSTVGEPDLVQQYHSQRAKEIVHTGPQAGKNEVLKLIIYLIPVLAIFFLVTKSIDDEDFMWHVRQSLVAQAVWFAIMIVLTIISLPIISTLGLTLWKIAGYVLLIIAGGFAYSHQRYSIPIVYDIGKKFIEDEK